MEIHLYQDIHTAFAGEFAPLKKDVAKAMGMTPESFSGWIRHRDARVRPAWAQRFLLAWDEASAKVDRS